MGQGMLVGCGVAAFGGVQHWMVNNGTVLVQPMSQFSQ
jgi:hypothetical protein